MFPASKKKKSIVIPAKAGIHLDLRANLTDVRKSEVKVKVKMDPSFRWDDDE